MIHTCTPGSEHYLYEYDNNCALHLYFTLQTSVTSFSKHYSLVNILCSYSVMVSYYCSHNCSGADRFLRPSPNHSHTTFIQAGSIYWWENAASFFCISSLHFEFARDQNQVVSRAFYLQFIIILLENLLDLIINIFLFDFGNCLCPLCWYIGNWFHQNNL